MRSRAVLEITAAAHAERTMDPAGQHNQAFSMLLELFQIDSRSEVHTVEDGRSHERAEVVVALRRLDEEDEIPPAVGGSVIELVNTLWPNPQLSTEDGMNACTLRGLVELHGSIEVAGVRQRDGLHVQCLGLSDDLARSHCPIEDGVLAAVVEVDERHGLLGLIRHRRRSSPWPHRPILVLSAGLFRISGAPGCNSSSDHLRFGL